MEPDAFIQLTGKLSISQWIVRCLLESKQNRRAHEPLRSDRVYFDGIPSVIPEAVDPPFYSSLLLFSAFPSLCTLLQSFLLLCSLFFSTSRIATFGLCYNDFQDRFTVRKIRKNSLSLSLSFLAHTETTTVTQNRARI